MEDQVTETIETKPVKTKKEPAPNALPEKEIEQDVVILAEHMNLAAWERAGLFKAAGWAPGKQVVLSVFTAALVGFRARRQGGGRIKA